MWKKQWLVEAAELLCEASEAHPLVLNLHRLQGGHCPVESLRRDFAYGVEKKVS